MSWVNRCGIQVWVGQAFPDSGDQEPTVGPTSLTSPDVDWEVVDRALRGWPIVMTPAERAEAVRTLHGQGASDRQIASQLGLHMRTVLRVRQALNLAGHAQEPGASLRSTARRKAAA